uniref:Uncharacterized protein n=1 Tax=Anguilla anguilla TaxID=7936 RepID=A0A0E9R558_ANGAN
MPNGYRVSFDTPMLTPLKAGPSPEPMRSTLNHT